nr:dTDP-4-dehydrorhamnose 3,5-epimerase [Variovorax sp. dw_954]
MRFVPTKIGGLFEVEIDARRDERGLFARTYDAATFGSAGLVTNWPQCNTSFNERRGTLRGLHYQAEPHPEPKLVRCTRGRIFDVAVDLRLQSPTRYQWAGVELNADHRNAFYIPAGFAHGFLTLEEDVEVFYQMGANYVAELARGVRWNDPAFAITWPFSPSFISARDANYPDVTL